MPPPLQANYLLQQIITGLGLSDLYRVHIVVLQKLLRLRRKLRPALYLLTY